jgi:hypothetical protein
VFILGFALLVCLPLQAQVAGGSIFGSVCDPGGGAVQTAGVAIKDVATGVVRTTVTNSVGAYAIPNLQPGTYEVTVTAPGFSRAVVTGIALTVGAQEPVNVTLALGATSEQVQVVGTAAGIELATSSLGAEVGGGTIRELPLNGRDWTQLATLEPGVNTIRNQYMVGSDGSTSASKATRGFGTQLSVGGARPSQNNFRLDGISFNDYTNDGPGGVLGPQSGVDAIREFSVLTNNYSAEYGKTSGGVVNAVTRSGENQFHGDAYEFLRNSALDARNFFDKTLPPFRRNQFGVAAGGPLRRNKVFWFANYEGLRQALWATQVSTVLSANARNGILSTGNVTVNPKIKPYLGFWPLPNGVLSPGGDTGNYSVQTLQTGNENFLTTRADGRLSDADTLAGTFAYDRTQLTQPDRVGFVRYTHRLERPFGTLEETHVFSSRLVNSLRAGFNRNGAVAAPLSAENPLAADLTLGSIPGRPAAGISVPGIFGLSGGIGGMTNFVFGYNSYQVYDDAFLSKGSHSLKFGFALERIQSNNLFHFTDDGSFKFGSLAAFLTDTPTRFTASLPSVASPRGLRQSVAGGYVQDDWHARQNLTINLGVRFEAATVPTEVQNKLSVWRNILDTQPHLGSPYFSNPTLRNFEPRVGFAWDPGHNGKTALRGGFGLFDVLPLTYLFLRTSSGAFPYNFTLTGNNLPVGAFPDQAYAIALSQTSANTTIGQRAFHIEQNPRRSYVMQWNVNLQRQLLPHVTASAAYVGSRGVHLPYATDDINTVMPTATPAGYLWPANLNGTVLNPSIGTFNSLTWGADSYYHSLQLQATVKAAKGVQLRTSYTWGKSIDTGSSAIAGDQFTNSPTTLPVWFDAHVRRSVSDYNLAQNLVLSGVWSLPGPRSLKGPVGWALKGWEASGVLQVATGAPFSALIGGDPLGEKSSDGVSYPNVVSGPGCTSPVNPGNPNHYIRTECFAVPNPITLLGDAGRNLLTGPGLRNLDFSLIKNSRIPGLPESGTLQFRAEAFNLLNNVNFAAPLATNTLFSQNGAAVGNAGTIQSTQTTSRQLQFGVKLIW